MKLKVNGKNHNFRGDPAMPILWYLRDELALTGTKFGCGAALCGACTVHLDKQAVRACITPMSVAEGRAITTIDGLSVNGDQPLQKAWAQHNVPQCGYCQSGQIMQAAVLLQNNSAPGDDDIDTAMAGNICRCGTYDRIRKTIEQLAEAGK